MTDLSLNCGAASDVGLVRDHNEDRYWIDPAHGAFLVVDGVGGQAAGERAAEIAVVHVWQAILPADLLVVSGASAVANAEPSVSAKPSPPPTTKSTPNPNKIPNSPEWPAS